MIIHRGTETNNYSNNKANVFVQPIHERLQHSKESSIHADLYAYASAQAYRDLVEAQLTQTEHLRRALSDNLHQVKNPLQALRAFGKLLQRKLAINDPSMISSSSTSSNRGSPTIPLRELADRMMIQTDRVIELLKPMENIIYQLEVNSIRAPQQYLYLPAGSNSNSSLTIQYFLKPAPVDIITSEHEGESLRYFYLPGSNGDSSPTIHYLNPAKYTTSSPRQQSAYTTEEISRPDLNLELETQKLTPLVSSNLKRNIYPQLPSQGLSPKEEPLDGNNIEMAFISDVIKPVLSNAAVVAADRHVKFEVMPYDEDELPGLMICPSSMQEALANVIDNAIKYVVLRSSTTRTLPSDSSSTTTATCRLDMAENLDPHVRVSVVPNPQPKYPKGVSIIVEDNGPGIPRKEREAIFLRGFRGIHTKDILSGNGLGLDISRSMLSKFGGTLEVIENESQHLSGTVMRIMVFR
jgi:signal transduction histidine kinase